eukprot:scaffold48558_cov54-Phaeocystis_antarctica.AAC.2
MSKATALIVLASQSRVCCSASSLVSGGAAAAARPSGDRAMYNAASSAVAKVPRLTTLPLRPTFPWKGLGWPGWLMPTPKKPVLLAAVRSVSPSACACCRTSWPVSGSAAAAFPAAALPSGDRATHRAASSAVANARKSSPSCSRRRVASAPPPAPAAAPPRSSAAPPLQPAPPLPPSPPAIARRTAPPPRRW